MTRMQAQRRNFLKYRLTGIHLDTKTKCLTEFEIEKLELIKHLVLDLLTEWDSSSLEFVEEDSSAFKKYKCFCGQRSNVKRIMYNSDNSVSTVCKKHYKQYLQEQKSK